MLCLTTADADAVHLDNYAGKTYNEKRCLARSWCMDDATQRTLEHHAAHYKRYGLQTLDPDIVAALDSLIAFYETIGFGTIALEVKNHQLFLVTQSWTMTLDQLRDAIKNRIH